MKNARRLGRLGMLAVGLGIGAAMAAAPGIASADSAADPFNFFAGLDPLSAATTAPTAAPFDLEISANGMTLLDLGDGTAHATSALGDLAIAFGANSTAHAVGGFGDSAIAGTGATAVAGDTATGATGNNFDFASAGGIGSLATAGNTVATTSTTGSSFDYASSSSGNNTIALDGAHSFSGFNGDFDSASAVGQEITASAGEGTLTNFANFDGATLLSNLSAPTTGVFLPFVSATGGSSDNSFVIDPFGTAGSSAISGGISDSLPHNFDLAGVFGDHLHAMANTGSYIVEILPSLFGESAAATDVGSFLTDIGSGLFSF